MPSLTNNLFCNFQTKNSQHIDQQPIRESSIHFFWYFVLFITFAVFVTFNVIVSVLLPHFKSLLDALTSKRREKSSTGSDSSATAAISGNVDNEIALSTESKIVKFVRSPLFNRIAYLICWAYIVSLMFDHYGLTGPAATALQYIDLLFGLLLIVELILRLVCAGTRISMKNAWNVLDALICALFIAGMSRHILRFAIKYIELTSALSLSEFKISSQLNSPVAT